MLRRLLLYMTLIVVTLAFVGAIVVGSGAAAEYLLRHVYRDITTTGDNSSWFARQWYLQELGRDLVDLNSLGYRDPEPVRPKPAGRLRVAVIGDSFTFGQGIAEEDRFTNLLNRRYRNDNIPIDVINMGKSGSGIHNYLRNVEVNQTADPDFVLIQWLPNDLEIRNHHQTVTRPVPKNLFPARWRKYHYHYHKHSVLYYLLNRGWHSLQGMLGTVPTYADYMQARFGDADSPDAQFTLRQFVRLVDAYRRQEIAVGFVLFPFLESGLGTEDYAFAFLHQRVMAICKRRRLVCLDLQDAFDAYRGRLDELHVNQFDAHPNAIANAIAAEQIDAAFRGGWDNQLSASPE